MINFDHEDSIVEYVKANLQEFLTDGVEVPGDYIVDDLDLDKYKKKNTVFFEFPDYDFEYMTNESNEASVQFSIFFAVRGDTYANLKKKLKEYAVAFYKMFAASGTSFGGVVDFGKVDNMHFYPAAAGDVSVKVVELSMTLKLEM